MRHKTITAESFVEKATVGKGNPGLFIGRVNATCKWIKVEDKKDHK